MKLFKKFAKDESGATLVEYAAAVAVVLIVGITAMTPLGNQVATNFTSATTSITP